MTLSMSHTSATFSKIGAFFMKKHIFLFVKNMFGTIICVSVFELFLKLLMKVQCEQPVIRQTLNGPVEGIEQLSVLNQRYYSFRGIPYAEAPITGIDPYTGEKVDRRFKAPETLKRNWTTPLKVHQNGKSCIPADLVNSTDPQSFSEDCLKLNIFVPADGARLKTTIVFIHGGGFSIEAPSDDHFNGPDFLLSQDNIVIYLRFRLAIFGFLNLGHGEYTGNMGLKDQQMAIKWIYENIEHFSGNKDEILLLGQSSGSASVQLHMLNSISRKYFNRAFLMSGSALQSYVLRRGNHIVQIKSCAGVHGIGQIIDYLKTANTSVLADCHVPGKDVNGPFSYWVPYIESPDSKQPFLSQELEDIYNSDKAPVMDTMISFASQESIQFRNESLNETVSALSDDWKRKKFNLPFKDFTKAHPKEFKWAVEKLRNAYFSNKTSVEAIRRANIDLFSDAIVTDAIIKTVALQANVNNRDAVESRRKKTFLYRVSIHADLNLYRIYFNATYNETAHSDDRCYIFYCSPLDSKKLYEKALQHKDSNYEIIMRFIKIITNFARTGDPSIEGDTPFKNCRSSNEIFCQALTNEPKTYVMNDIKEQRHYDVWREIEKVALKINGKSSSSRLVQGTLFIFISFHLFSFIFTNHGYLC